MNLPPIDTDTTNILKLPIKPTTPPDEQLFLVPPPLNKCCHFNGPFEVDQDAGKCKCLKCGEEVSPIFVLTQLMMVESRWNQTRLAYQAEMKRLSERSKTKCEHCHKMTSISRN